MFPRPRAAACSSPELTDDETSPGPSTSGLTKRKTISSPESVDIISDDDDFMFTEYASKYCPNETFASKETVEISSDDSSLSPESKPKLSKWEAIDTIFGSSNTTSFDDFKFRKKSFGSGSSKTYNLKDSSDVYNDLGNKSVKPHWNDIKRNLWDKYENKPNSKSKTECVKQEEIRTGPPQHSLSIGGVEVHFPVKPYGCQTALMFKVITGLSKSQNCLLESPTGSGKTLALLCGALAWQRKEKARIAGLVEQQCFNHYSDATELTFEAESPRKSSSPVKPAFTRIIFGEKSIYDNVNEEAGSGDSSPGGPFKRPEPAKELGSPPETNRHGLVKIHKRRKLDDGSSSSEPSAVSTPEPQSPDMNAPPNGQQTPKSVREIRSFLHNLRLRTTMYVDSSLPTIYYGARTHKQIQQVVKEFKRTAYCGDATMSILSSREYSCIRPLEKDYPSRNDMCRDLVSGKKKRKGNNGEEETGCIFYDSKKALSKEALPPAWDLEDLVSKGKELHACPYYGARKLAESANIVFCPYNYLIDPAIRNSLNIHLENQVIILDEAHNIEDICREAASLTFTRDDAIRAYNEIEPIVHSKYQSSHEFDTSLRNIYMALSNWDHWFHNQCPLLKETPNTNEMVHAWQAQHFLATLDSHNIGQRNFREFSQSVAHIISTFREEPDKLKGLTMATAALLEAIVTSFEYLFREDGTHIDDFKPILMKTVTRSDESLPNSMGWRSSQFKSQASREVLTLKLLCMNPAVVFSSLLPARTVLLSSGTLSPIISLHSELGCTFPLVLSTAHVIPHDRVWIGSLLTCPDGENLECTSRGSGKESTQDAIGRALLWVTTVTPHGVLCFLPSYSLMNRLIKRWQETNLWSKLQQTKHVFTESRNVRDHSEVMEEYYSVVGTDKGALLLAVYRGKVSEGMDFKDEQARAVITVGIPYPNTYEAMISNKMQYNDAHKDRQLLSGREWLRVQAYRALNQAVGRCVRHRSDWGAVLLIDTRFQQLYYTEHLSKWVRNFLGGNHHSWDSLVNNPDSLESFIQNMTIREAEEQL